MNVRPVTLKSLSGTRWNARTISTKVVYENYNKIYENLQTISEDKELKKNIRDEAKAILKKMKSLDIAFILTLWYDILERFNATNRLSAYTAIEEKFEFLLKFKSLNSDEIAAAAGNLNAYKTDLEHFGKEIIQFKEFIDGIETPSPLEALETIKGNKTCNKRQARAHERVKDGIVERGRRTDTGWPNISNFAESATPAPK
ncbi:hypothetical protein NQ314_008053 [Rhamnusium bicolor]|uniref:Uncharacterized protein n=1 Tax=Rhamnusium bicolor TaxID=1586634 RepID=A0AAV8YEE5_9CUCU|nr:hypothetical protein NQ314_008053 [Rhamnusium bicolor]